MKMSLLLRKLSLRVYRVLSLSDIHFLPYEIFRKTRSCWSTARRPENRNFDKNLAPDQYTCRGNNKCQKTVEKNRKNSSFEVFLWENVGIFRNNENSRLFFQRT